MKKQKHTMTVLAQIANWIPEKLGALETYYPDTVRQAAIINDTRFVTFRIILCIQYN